MSRYSGMVKKRGTFPVQIILTSHNLTCILILILIHILLIGKTGRLQVLPTFIELLTNQGSTTRVQLSHGNCCKGHIKGEKDDAEFANSDLL